MNPRPPSRLVPLSFLRTPSLTLTRLLNRLILVPLLCPITLMFAFPLTSRLQAAPDTSSPSRTNATPASLARDDAWQRVVAASEDPPEGKAIRGRRVIGEDRVRLRALLHPREWTAADLAAEFRRKHPAHPQARAALKIEVQQLILAGDVAVDLDTNLFQRATRVVRELVRETRIPGPERFNLAAAALNRMAYARFNGLTNKADAPALLQQELQDARFLQEAFPDVPEIWNLLELVAGQLPPDQARPVLDDIITRAPDGSAKARAEGLKWRLNAVGKPLQLVGTALDGREVQLSAWRGKVVLINFWATWCAPCVAEQPRLREAYDRFHASGLEVVGISLDTDQEALVQFLAKHGHPWPQIYDGRGWDSELVIRHGVSLVPALWLIDHEGVIRTLDAREDLNASVSAALAERRHP